MTWYFTPLPASPLQRVLANTSNQVLLRLPQHRPRDCHICSRQLPRLSRLADLWHCARRAAGHDVDLCVWHDDTSHCIEENIVSGAGGWC